MVSEGGGGEDMGSTIMTLVFKSMAFVSWDDQYHDIIR